MNWVRQNYKKFLVFLPLVLILFISGCVTARVLHHDPLMAAMEAQKFADAAFVQHDPQKAYDLSSDGMKQSHSLEEFTGILENLHPTGYPSEVTATEYEPILGQAAMSIFLEGQNENENFYYRLVMKGTSDEGYRVDGFYRGNGPYPESSLRMPLTPSTSDNISK
jgi:hypothetical protein